MECYRCRSLRRPQLGRDQAENPRRIPSHNRIVGHVAGHDAAGSDDGILPDDHVRQDRRPGPDRRAFPHQRCLDLPIHLGLEFPRRSRRPRIGVVDEDDAVADEDVVLDCHAFTDEGVARNLALPADLRIFLDLDERPDLCSVADLAAVEIDELPQLDVGRHVEGFVHWQTTLDLRHCPGPCQQAPFPEMTAAGVARRILRSFQRERVLAYRRSRRTISSKVVRLRPATCQSPVIPGLASTSRRRCQSLYSTSSYGSGGRGPISDISPRSTFHNCGSSSRLVFRRRRPIGVTRGSPVSLNSVAPGSSTLPLDLMNRLTNSWCSLGSASTCIVRNLSIVNRFIMCPIRGCRKKTGPGDPRVTRTAISASSGDSATSKNRLPTRSKARLIPS